MSDVLPIKYSIYKGVGGKNGATQFSVILPHCVCSENRKHRVYEGPVVKAANFSRDTPCTWEGCNGKLSVKEGAVFMEMAPAVGPNKYDWAQSIRVALSITDLSKLLIGLKTGSEVSLVHDPNKGNEQAAGTVVKGINFSSPKGLKQGGFLTLTQTTKGKEETQKRQLRVGVSPDEVMALGILFTAIIPKLLAWS